MNKKFLSLVLALVMVLGTFGNVFAAAAPAKKDEAKKEAKTEAPKLTSTDAKVQWLIDNKIVIGNADADGKATGEMGLDKPIRRDHVAKMLVFAMGEQDLAAKLQGVYRPFPDVELTSIVNGFIATAASKTSNGVPIIAGYEDGTFRPTREVTYAELAKMLVVAIDKDLTPAKVKGMRWYQDWMDRAVQLGILDGVKVDNANAKAVRKDAFAMIYNAFFQLKQVKAVPANETRGIISEHSKAGKLVLNQGEFKKEFKVNDDTVYVRQDRTSTKWLDRAVMYARNYEVGSLVRVLSDKDGVVTHIIEMGNPYDGVMNKDNAWVDLGKVVLQKDASFERAKDVKGMPLDARKDTKKVFVGKDYVALGADKEHAVKYDVTSRTEFYVADYKAGALTKVKDFDAAKALLAKDVKGVYLGYEALPKAAGNEARIIVFNEVDKKMNERIVRVASGVSNPSYILSVQAPGENETTVEQFNLRDNAKVWPYNYGFEAKDVLAVTNNKFDKETGFVIKYEKDPIVKINKFLLIKADGTEKEVARAQANAVELIDKDDYTSVFALPTDYNAFFGKDLRVGAHVQYALDGNKISVLSEVGNDPLRGDVYGGKPSYLKKAVVDTITEVKNDLYRVTVKFDGSKKEVTLVAPKMIADQLAKDKEYNFLLGKVNKDNYDFEIIKATETEDQLAANKFVEAEKASTEIGAANDFGGKAAKDVKAELVELIKEYKALPEGRKAFVKEQLDSLNKKIEAYNKLAGIAEADKLEVVK